MNDLKALKTCGAPLNGAISGRALYDGIINVPEATAFLKS
jgi:phosphoribosylformimino-5-aminoimidazole carboxamide ribotide isomerase